MQIRWEGQTDSPELDAAKALAAELDLPLAVMATLQHHGGHSGHIMRVPTIGAMVICHRHMNDFGYLATGLSPEFTERDSLWNELLLDMINRCRPGMKLLHPRDGITRSEMLAELPANLRERLYVGPGRKDDRE